MKFLRSITLFSFLLLTFIFASAQNCTLTCPANIVASAAEGQEGTVVNFPAQNFPAECGTVTYTPASGSFFRLGSHSISVTSSTGQKCSFTVTVSDNNPPTLSPITLSRDKIWPASNKMKKVKVGYVATDNSEQVKTTITVKSNAPEPSNDWEIIDDHLIRLKSSRLPDGTPRVYTITVTAMDESGNKTTRTTSVAVSQTMVAKPIVK